MSNVQRVIQFGRDRYEWNLPEITGGELRRLCNIPGGDDVFRQEAFNTHVGPPIEYDEIVPLAQMPPPMQASLRIVAIPRFIDGGFADARSVASEGK